MTKTRAQLQVQATAIRIRIELRVDRALPLTTQEYAELEKRVRLLEATKDLQYDARRGWPVRSPPTSTTACISGLNALNLADKHRGAADRHPGGL